MVVFLSRVGAVFPPLVDFYRVLASHAGSFLFDTVCFFRHPLQKKVRASSAYVLERETTFYF